MHTYILTSPKDANGQPVRMFRAARENNEAKAMDQLSGICEGILADGVVSDQEASFFAEWVRKHGALQPVWPFTDILSRVERIFADGICTEEERQELKEIMEGLCGHQPAKNAGETYSSTLPFNVPPPNPIQFVNRIFNITGKFAFGPRRKVMDSISGKGGIAIDATPTHESDYLIVGIFASRDWIHTNYGRKIERAIELRNLGSGIIIIPEEHWKQFVA